MIWAETSFIFCRNSLPRCMQNVWFLLRRPSFSTEFLRLDVHEKCDFSRDVLHFLWNLSAQMHTTYLILAEVSFILLRISIPQGEQKVYSANLPWIWWIQNSSKVGAWHSKLSKLRETYCKVCVFCIGGISWDCLYDYNWGALHFDQDFYTQWFLKHMIIAETCFILYRISLPIWIQKVRLHVVHNTSQDPYS